MEDEQNRHSTGYLREHARSVDCTSPGTATLQKTSRIVESHGKRTSLSDQQTRTEELDRLVC